MGTDCLVLYSGGLDSILACKVLQGQGLRVLALRYVSPFFGHSERLAAEEAQRHARTAYGIDMQLIDISERFLRVAKAPDHGYGRHLNPCIDCKILLIRQTLQRMKHFGARFIATGEVLGQRPMSQGRHSLGLIERKSGAAGLLLRPLSARYLPLTAAEHEGLVDRSRLLGLTGRGRKGQIALAARYGIRDFPAPSGGCRLADPVLSRRLRRIFELWPDIDSDNCLLAQIGRHFLMPDGSWLVISRNESENARLLAMRDETDELIAPADMAGPLGLWRQRGRGMGGHSALAAGIVARFANPRGTVRVKFSGPGRSGLILEAKRLPDETLARLRL